MYVHDGPQIATIVLALGGTRREADAVFSRLMYEPVTAFFPSEYVDRIEDTLLALRAEPGAIEEALGRVEDVGPKKRPPKDQGVKVKPGLVLVPALGEPSIEGGDPDPVKPEKDKR